jgi:hypothetical protein
MPRGRPRKVVSEATEKNLVDSMVAEVDNSSVESGDKAPAMSSPEWNSFVLSQLEDDEKDERTPGVVVPKTDGLGRLVRLLIGDTIESGPVPITVHEGYAAIIHKMVVIPWDDPGVQLTYSGIGDASQNNTDSPYNKFLPQIAHTRAKGRAYKDILGLKNVVTSEELSEVAEKDVLITSAQLVGFKNLCKSLKINILKFINLNGSDYKKLEEVPKNEASRMLAKLQEYKRGEDDIPKEILEV